MACKMGKQVYTYVDLAKPLSKIEHLDWVDRTSIPIIRFSLSRRLTADEKMEQLHFKRRMTEDKMREER